MEVPKVVEAGEARGASAAKPRGLGSGPGSWEARGCRCARATGKTAAPLIRPLG
jgi:hypothetical protein